MSVLAVVRPDSWNYPLFVHVLGAMVLVGGMVFAITAELVAAGSATPERFRKIAFRTFLLVALPAYIVMRAGAEWIHSKEFPSGVDDPTWVGIGFITVSIWSRIEITIPRPPNLPEVERFISL